jgi:hypothetical protein
VALAFAALAPALAADLRGEGEALVIMERH